MFIIQSKTEWIKDLVGPDQTRLDRLNWVWSSVLHFGSFIPFLVHQSNGLDQILIKIKKSSPTTVFN